MSDPRSFALSITRVLTSAVPIAGGVVTQILSEIESHFAAKDRARLEELLENLRSKLDTLKLEVAKLPTAEAVALLRDAFAAIPRTHSELKRRQYAHVLARVLIDDVAGAPTIDEKARILADLDALTERDLLALRLFTEETEAVTLGDLAWRTLEGNTATDKVRALAASVKRLESRGLVILTRAIDGTTYITDGLDAASARLLGLAYLLLPPGAALNDALWDGGRS